MQTPADDLRPGDTIVAVTPNPGTNDLSFTVRRIGMPEPSADT
ncbi:hypothetical protein [Nocardia iowensis]|nr:hypothetical protein [Nocardia iowensis]